MSERTKKPLIGGAPDQVSLNMFLGELAFMGQEDLELDKYLEKSSVVQEAGDSEDAVMSQKAVTDALDSIDIPELPDIVSSNTDTSGGNKLITQGWMGLGARLNNDNSIRTKFVRYGTSDQPTGYKSSWYGYGVMWTIQHDYSGDCADILITHENTPVFAFRPDRGRSWQEVYHTGNKPSWGDISGKPSSFSPSSHNHSASDITSGTFSTSRIPNLNADKITSGTLNGARMPMGAGGVGTYAMVASRSGVGASWNETVNGGDLYRASGAGASTSSLSGTWRIMSNTVQQNGLGLAVRIS